MRMRWVVAVGAALVGCGANAQPSTPSAPSTPAIPSPAPTVPQNPSPLLLPVPNQSQRPLAEVPRPGPPGIEYDPNYLYLPEQIPEQRAANECGPAGRWWVGVSLELAWVPARPAPTNVRLRIPNPILPVIPVNTVPGPVLPTAGRSAGRFDAALNLVLGYWFDEGRTHGVDASFFSRDAHNTFDVTAPGSIVVFPRGNGRGSPTVIPFSSPVAFGIPSIFPATLDTYFATVDVNYRHRLFCNENSRLDVIAGYRYAFLGDELYLGEFADDGNSDYRRNRAAVSNNFHGGQIGLAGEVRSNAWYVSGAAKIAFGGTTSEATTTGLFWGAEGFAGIDFQRLRGLMGAEQTNFAVLPSFNVQVGCQLTRHLRLFGGYSFAYLSRTARLGDALSPVSTNLVITDFWVQSIGFGGEFRF